MNHRYPYLAGLCLQDLAFGAFVEWKSGKRNQADGRC